MTRLLIHWARFGPYHLARLKASRRLRTIAGIEVLGLEIASRDPVYLWRMEAERSSAPRHTVFPGQEYCASGKKDMWRQIWRALDSLKPDLVAINGYSLPDSQSILAWCKLHRCPTILMTESKEDDAERTGLKEWLKSRVIRQFDAALCGGTPHRRYLKKLGFPEERIFLGYDAVDNDFFWDRVRDLRANPDPAIRLTKMGPESSFFLASARFAQRKNLDGLLRAYSAFRNDFAAQTGSEAKWNLVILGDGDEANNLRRLAGELGLADVIFAGFRQIEELPAFYARADVFIHPAHQEPWGLVVNEAMASGLPIIVSEKCGCAPDLVRNGINGFTFHPSRENELSKLMLAFATGVYDIAQMGVESRRIIDRYSPNAFASGIRNAVATCLQQ